MQLNGRILSAYTCPTIWLWSLSSAQVSVDGEWLCLKELQELGELATTFPPTPGDPPLPLRNPFEDFPKRAARVAARQPAHASTVVAP